VKKIFVLGVGAQKSGTTWLHHYLSSLDMVNMGEVKEYHIWDALHIKECRSFLVDKTNFRYKLQTREGAYESYFESLIQGGVTHTGDITPAYSGLDKYSFRLIRAKMERLGFTVKVVFLMRDPFERCWSAVRMVRRFKATNSIEINDLRNYYKSSDCDFRTDYKKTILSLGAAFDRENIWYGIYEELFFHEKLKQLSNFCEVPCNPNLIQKRFNASPKTDDSALALKDEIVKHYKHVYDFCYEEFPQTKILWSQI
jgi:hypothetical protein